jgi:Short C-terminal domain
MLGKLSRRTQRKLEDHGTHAPATVVAISDRGMTVSHNGGHLVADTEVILKTHLRVEPAGEPSFEVEKRLRYDQLAMPSAGSQLAVIFNPEDHDELMLDPAGPAAGVMATVIPGLGSVQDLLTTVRSAKAEAGGDRQAMTEALLAQFGGGAAVVGGGGGFGTPPDPLDELAKLGELHRNGVLTDEEFTAQKRRLLGGSPG